MSHQPQFKAGGTIRTSRFISMDIAGDENNTVIESNAGDAAVVGVTTEAAQDAPQSGASVNAAEDGDQVEYRGPGQECMLSVAETVATCGAWLMPDAEGEAVLANATDDIGWALSLEEAAVGEIVKALFFGPHHIK
jgi:hypothetical protein